MAQVDNRQVNIFIETGSAQAALDILKKKEQELKEALKSATDPRVVKALTADLKKLEQPINVATKKLKGELSPTVKDLEKTVASLTKEFKNLSKEDPEFNKKILQLKKATLELNQARKEASFSSSNVSDAASGSIRGRIQSTAAGVSRGILEGFGLGVGINLLQAIPGFVNDAISEFTQADLAVTRLQNKLDNLGKGDAFPRIVAKAQEMADKFKYLDNDDVVGVFDKLITYGRLTERQMNQLLPVIIDFAADARISLDESASIITKALEGNGKSLKEYGINIKDAGTVTERFNVITTTLADKVKGAADAFGNSMAGSIASAQQRVKDLQEEIGGKLLPLKVKLLEFLSDIATGFSRFTDAIQLSISAGINPFTADAILRLDRVRKEFARTQADTEFTDLKGLDRADLGTKLIQLNNEAEQIKSILDRNRKESREMGSGFLSDQSLSRYETRLAVIRELVNKINSEVNQSDSVLGIDSADGGKKTEDNFSSLIEKIKQKARELSLYGMPQLERDISNANAFYDQLIKQAKGRADLINQIEALRVQETFQILDAYNTEQEKKEEKVWLNQSKRRLQIAEQEAELLRQIEEQRLKKLRDFTELIYSQLAQSADKALGGRKFRQDVDQLIGNRQERLAAQIEQLNDERSIEIKNAEQTGKDVYDINRKYDKLISNAKKADLKELVGEYLAYAGQVSNIIGQAFSFQNDRDQAELDSINRKNELEKKKYQEQLDKKLIDRKTYDREIAKLDAKAEQKDKELRIAEFNRKKITALLDAGINIAEAITEALPDPFRVTFASILGAAQLGFIAAQQPPKFGKGGALKGRGHNRGGMPVIDPDSGTVQAEVEGGEVILSKQTVKNNPFLVSELLKSSLYKNGATIGAEYANVAALPRVNFSRAQQSIQRVTRFERGGVFPDNSGTAKIDTLLTKISATLGVLASKLDEPIRGVFSIQQLQTESDRLSAIENDVTMK